MFEANDHKYIVRQLARNQVVLFLGAGFSRDAKNLLNENFPSGWELGRKFWEFLGYDGEYDDTPLPQMYQRFINAGIKLQEKEKLLNENLSVGEVPSFYDALTIPYWYKIYTLNVDDLLDKIFIRKTKNFEILKYPKDEYTERDQSLESTLITHLHGKLPCNPSDIIFSTNQYAKANLAHQPLYGQFVWDYATLPTIFIGTELDEPLFETYIVARENRVGTRELRPKSFIITPPISPVKRDNLIDNHNVFHIKGTVKDFLSWLKDIESELPPRIEILKNIYPNLLDIVEYADLSGVKHKTINAFSKAFNRVPFEFQIRKERSGFLTGSSPRWNDIYRDLDIPRSISTEILDKSIEILDSDEYQKVKTVTISGSAGSGKSTILKRVGLLLSQAGRTVFLSYSDHLPRINDITDVLERIDDRVVLIFDNSKNVIGKLNDIISNLNQYLKYPPLIILGIRSNYSTRLNQYINPDITDRYDYKIPDLNDVEIKQLIQKLDVNNLLGILKGRSEKKRFNEFKYRAKRQILVAMKEATNGKSFNDIISDEFNSIEPYEAKILCLCVALNTELGYTNTKQDLVGFSKDSHNEALNYLNQVLEGTIMWGNNGRNFMLRHRILADYIIKNCVDHNMLKEAYVRVLSVLAPELKKTHSSARKKFTLYKSLINHRTLYSRFKKDIDLAREVFESITDFFSEDDQFWLQYGSLEIEGEYGDLDLAENYLNQAESLSPKSTYIQNAKCNLYYKQSIVAKDYTNALEIKEIADQLADKLLLEKGKSEPYTFHICCAGRYRFIVQWIRDRDQKVSALKDLRGTIRTATRLHPFDKRLEVASNAIERAYLQMGASGDQEDPPILGFQ